MISWRNLLQVTGFFILALALSLGLVTLVALFLQDAGFRSLALATLMAMSLGGFLCLVFRSPPQVISNREGILLVIII